MNSNLFLKHSVPGHRWQAYAEKASVAWEFVQQLINQKGSRLLCLQTCFQICFMLSSGWHTHTLTDTDTHTNTHKGSLSVVSIGTSVYTRVCWITQLLFQYAYLPWWIMTASSWVFYLDLYLFVKQSLPCTASKGDAGCPKMNLPCSLLNWLQRTELNARDTEIKLSYFTISLCTFDVICYVHICILFFCCCMRFYLLPIIFSPCLLFLLYIE